MYKNILVMNSYAVSLAGTSVSISGAMSLLLSNMFLLETIVKNFQLTGQIIFINTSFPNSII
jgi:hypothetical protein